MAVENRYKCIWCGKIITENTAYMSKSDTCFTIDTKNGGKDNRAIWCKDCMNQYYIDQYTKTNGNTSLAIYKTCRKFDYPFISEKLDHALNQLKELEGSREKVFQIYMTKLFSMKFKLGDPICFEHGETEFREVYIPEGTTSEELEQKWGLGFKPYEYDAFEKKYKFLTNNYPEKTSLHTEALYRYIRFSCKAELAMADNNSKEAKEWDTMASKAASDAKINPKQLTQADLQGGLTCFSEVSQMAEQVVDIIEILPQFKYRPIDAVDFIMWCYINYERDAQGLPQVSYRDVWSFYDKKKKEYLDQYGDPYGIFTNDPTEDNRPNIEKFITLPKEEVDDTDG
jgi:hypothetical protein